MAWGVASEQQGQLAQIGWRKGPWTSEEDKLLAEYVADHGEGRWSSVARCAGLNRSGKSCRLRWVNYLRPGLKRSQITPQEEGIIIELHALWGNKWSTIARYLPGRTDNEIKNYWRTHFKKKDKSSRRGERKKASQNLKSKQQKQQELLPQHLQTYDPKRSECSVTNHIDGILYAYPEMTMTEDQSYMAPLQPLNQGWQLDGAMCQDLDGLWNSSLWNFSEPTLPDQYCNKMALHTQLANNNNINAFAIGGDPNPILFNNGGYIF